MASTTPASDANSINDWLKIKIGGDDTIKKPKKEANRVKSTKYTLITFIPQNLLEQFRRIANFYFLVMTLISCFIDSPVSPLTSLLPLCFVIFVTATKQGYEDFLRYKTDNVVNCSPVTVIRNGREETIECQNIRQGDLVIITRDCDVPCDLVLLNSSDPHGKCFVTTANLDGESNLKILNVPRGLPRTETENFNKLGTIDCESPITDLYSFNGKITLTNQGSQFSPDTDIQLQPMNSVLPLTAENVLLRGSRVKNTECVLGCAVYIGMNTKLALNSRLTRVKAASSEMFINRFLIFILLGLIVIVTFLYLLKRHYELFVIIKHWYLGPAINTNSVKMFLQDYLSFLILFNYLIPISLYVTIEMHRVVGGLFMEWDLELYDENTDQPCVVNTSNLNEELGQVNILFSDKTGTLTKNEMIFQQCSINGKKFLYKKTKLQEDNRRKEIDINKFNGEQRTFFEALAVCHTIQVAGDGGEENHNQVPSAPTMEPSQLQNKSYSFADIAEESQNSSLQSDGEGCPLNSNPNGSDVNPLLQDKVERRRKIEIVRRSPKLYSSRKNGLNADERPITFPSSLQALPRDDRPNSFHYQRSTSSVEDMTDHSGIPPINHRRTQSYGAPVSFQRTSNSFSGLKRTGSTISRRESYAAPKYQESPLLRAESQRRKNEIENVVQMLDYQASSPDEKALVEACAHIGYVYLGDDDEILKIKVLPPHMDYSRPAYVPKAKELNFERLHVLEFTSDRKRMSVIVRDEKQDIYIYTKGAESYVFPLCGPSSADLIQKTDQHISDFAKLGLRTLAVARKKVTEQEYREFVEELAAANSALENRKQLSEECYAKIEQNLDLLGATAVEDALQDNVADTLTSLQEAGIRIWVLTGDKVETALNIALSCGHIPAAAMKYFIVECTSPEDLQTHLDALDKEILYGIGKPCALLIDGKSLAVALKDLPDRFREVTTKCVAVLCCRLSPLQKSEVVSLIKKGKENYITAAIGDGANDVSMIQEAHIGVGIMGKEGRQAARCADFAFAKFCLLKRLLLVHGHYHTSRLTFLVLYFFYKNIIFMMIMFLFQFYAMFSSVSVYDSLFLTLFNVIYTSLPIYFISLTEKPYKEETLMSTPSLYKKNTNNKYLHWKYFLYWVAYGVYHGLIVFYFAYCLFTGNDTFVNYGGINSFQTSGFSMFGTFMMQAVVVIVNLKLWMESKYQSYWHIAFIWASILSFVATSAVYTVLNLNFGDTDIYWAYINILSSISLWLLLLVIIAACLIPDYTVKMCREALNMPKLEMFPKRKGFLPNRQSTYL
ncbi:ATP11B family protein [Megaselia abdita]